MVLKSYYYKIDPDVKINPYYRKYLLGQGIELNKCLISLTSWYDH